MRVLIPGLLAALGLFLIQAADSDVGTAADASSPLVLAGAELPSAFSSPSALLDGAHPETFDGPPGVSVGDEVAPDSSDPTPEELTRVVRQYCVACHNDQLETGNLSLQSFEVPAAMERWETAEKMIRKLRAGQMPPKGGVRPGGDTLTILVQTLESPVDEAAAERPYAGSRSFQRLNRAEYRTAIRNLLGIEVDPGDWLPPDISSDGFDNIADAQPLSAGLLDSYLRAAAAISRIAVGDPNASSRQISYRVSRMASQLERVEGAPMGTRGGVSAIHHFPADGEYVFRMEFFFDDVGDMHGQAAPFDEQMEISIDGERVALLDIDRFMHESDPDGVRAETDPIFIRAGSRRVTAAFLQGWEGPVNDLLAPAGHSLVDVWIGKERGITNVTHLKELIVEGPRNPVGVSETETRRRIFTCRPTSRENARSCAEGIIGRLAEQAYRRPVTDEDLQGLMRFYDRGAEVEGFEEGIRMALEATLASPHFIFRMEEVPPDASPGAVYRLGDLELASRLSFFLWNEPPDAELVALAADGRLSDESVLDQQVERMLDDPRSEALATRFAGSWLRLAGLNAIQPDYEQYPDFDLQLREAMRRETEVFFDHLLRENRSASELFTADYTFINGRLARHYGFGDVVGDEFRRVDYPDDRRSGVLGHASILTLTSHGSRTSPVDRGKWILEVMIGTPPPPPPPDVDTELAAVEDAERGRSLTMRERMEIHRSNPACASCHEMIDPLGLVLENFDVVGQWRTRDGGNPVDSRSELWDGTPLAGATDLRDALMERQELLYRTFTQNLLTYAIGRRVEYHDMPTVRRIVRQAAQDDYRLRSFVGGVVRSEPFQMREVMTAADLDDESR